MALVRFDGGQVRCTLIRQDEHGGWICQSGQHAPRLSVGTMFRVAEGDVIERDGPEVGTSLSQGELEAAMASERETLPSLKQVLKDNPPIAHDAPGKIEET